MNGINVVVLAFLAVCVAVGSGSNVLNLPSDAVQTTRIIGGEDAEEGQFPYQVSLRNRLMGGTHFCGGSILNERFILTAAHCTQKLNAVPLFVQVVVGAYRRTTGGTKLSLSSIMPHEDYDASQFINDISLLRTKNQIVFSELVKPISLPTANIAEKTKVLASGWGLHKVTRRFE